MIKKVKNTVPWTYVISDLNDKEIVGSFVIKKSKANHRKSATGVDKLQSAKKDDLTNLNLMLMN